MLVRDGGQRSPGQKAFLPLAKSLCSGVAGAFLGSSGRILGSTSVVAPGLLVAGRWSLPAKRSRRRHVWLFGGGKAGEDGAGWYQEAGRTLRAKLREEDGALVRGMRGKLSTPTSHVYFATKSVGVERDAGVFVLFCPQLCSESFE